MTKAEASTFPRTRNSCNAISSTLLFPPTCRRKESRSCCCSRTPQLKETWRGEGLSSITVPGYSTLLRCHSIGACDSWSCHIHSQKQREISVYIFTWVCSAPYIQFSPGNGATHSELGLPHQLIKTTPYRCVYRPIQSRHSLTDTLFPCDPRLYKLIKALYHRRHNTKGDPPHKRSCWKQPWAYLDCV